MGAAALLIPLIESAVTHLPDEINAFHSLINAFQASGKLTPAEATALRVILSMREADYVKAERAAQGKPLTGPSDATSTDTNSNDAK